MQTKRQLWLNSNRQIVHMLKSIRTSIINIFLCFLGFLSNSQLFKHTLQVHDNLFCWASIGSLQLTTYFLRFSPFCITTIFEDLIISHMFKFSASQLKSINDKSQIELSNRKNQMHPAALRGYKTSVYIYIYIYI